MSRNPREYVYDVQAVQFKKCHTCGEYIGAEDYVEDHFIARLGQMFFHHKRCAPKNVDSGLQSVFNAFALTKDAQME